MISKNLTRPLALLIFEGALVLRQVHDRDDAARAARPLIQQLLEAHGARGRGA